MADPAAITDEMMTGAAPTAPDQAPPPITEDMMTGGAGAAPAATTVAPAPNATPSEKEMSGRTQKEWDDYRPPDPDTPASLSGTAKQFGYGAAAPFAWAGKKVGLPAPPQSLDPAQNPARNIPERLSRAAGEATGATAAGMGVAATLPEDVTAGAAGAIPSAVRFGQKMLFPSPSVSGLAGAAATGAGGEAAGEMVPENAPGYMRPLAQMVGGAASGIGLGAGMEGLGAIGRDTLDRQGVVQAGQGQGVDIPRFMATAPGAAAGNALSRLPFVGAPIAHAKGELAPAIGEAQDRLVQGLGSGDRAIAAPQVAQGLKDWIGTTSAARLQSSYARIGQAFNNQNPTDLANTRGVAQQILSEREGALGPDSAMTPGIQHVLEAATRPGGLNWSQMQLLRKELWDQPETKSNDVSRLWGALSDDMSEAAFNQGGLRGQRAADLSNTLAKGIIQRRQMLQKMIGSKPDESIYDTLVRSASDKAGGNVANLQLAKKTLAPQDWDELASGAIARMGRNPQGDFDPNKFMGDWNNLSSAGKDAMFGSPGMSSVRKNMDQIATLAGAAQRPSFVGQAGKVAGHAAGAGVATYEALDMLREGLSSGHSAALAAGAIGAGAGRLLASSLARPTTSGPATQLITAASRYAANRAPDAAQQIYGASARYAAALGTAYGVKVNPDDLVNALSPKATGSGGPQQ